MEPVNETHEKYACEEQGKLFVSGYRNLKGTWVSGYCRSTEPPTHDTYRTPKESIDDEAKRIVMEKVGKNAPEYLGLVSDMEFKTMKSKLNVKNGTVERAKIRGDTVYFDPELASNDAKFEHVLLHETAHMIEQEQNGIMGKQKHNDDFYRILQRISGEDVSGKYKKNGVLSKNAFN